MKIYKLNIGGEGFPRILNVLPIKYTDRGEWGLGFITYQLIKKGITKHYILNSVTGIISLPILPDLDYSKVESAEELLNIFLNKFNGGSLNTQIKSTAIELELNDIEKDSIVRNLKVLGCEDKVIFLE